MLTNKHKNNEINTVENKIVKNIFDCDCGKKYKDRTGLWKHKRTCNSVKKSDLATANNNDITFLTNLVLEVVKNNSELQKQNQELQIQMLEVIKNGTNNTTTTTNSNNNITNKTFNLQFFLNEECKDALNISEFVSSIKVELEDLEASGRLG